MERKYFKLKDKMDGSEKEVEGHVEIEEGFGIYFHFEGYGEATASPGHGYPLMIEVYDGKLRVIAWSNINEQDPTHTIDMEGAQEVLYEAG